MSRDKQQFLWILVSAFLLIMPMSGCSGNKILSRRFDHFWPYKNDEFRNLCRALDVPCGLELLPEDGFRIDYKARSKFNNMTTREILDVIVKQRPGYYWEVRHGVINMLPKSYQRKDFQWPLDKEIKHITIRESFLREFVVRIVFASGVRCAPSTGWTAPLIDRRKQHLQKHFTIELRDLTLRDALNKAAKAHGRMIWILQPTGEENEVICHHYSWKKTKKLDSREEEKLFQLYKKLDD